MENEYRILEPEVAGGFGPQTILDYTTVPPTVQKLHYEFGGWLGDDLLETTPCFIVTLPLKESLAQFGGTGYSFDDVVISKSAMFQERRPDIYLPEFSWLKIFGLAGSDDAGLGPNKALVVSSQLLDILKQHILGNCTIRKRPFRV
jgi:hypothetical protein